MRHDVRLRPLLPSNDPQLYARVLQDVAQDAVLRALTGTDPQAYPRLIQYPPFIEGSNPPDPPPDPTPDPDPAPTGAYTGSTKKEAIAKAILGTCRPCCGSGSSGGGTEGCTQCNECNWSSGSSGSGAAPTSFSLLAHSPSGGFADFTVTLNLLAPTGGTAWSSYHGIVFPAVPYLGYCDTRFNGTVSGTPYDYYANLVYQGLLELDWPFPGVDVGSPSCIGLPVAISGTNIKLYAYAMLANFVYKVGEDQCYSWLLALAFTDYRSPPTAKSASLQGSTIAGSDCDSAHTPIPSNMTVACTSPYFLASGTIVCSEENTDCDGITGAGVTPLTTLAGQTFTMTLS